MFYDFWSDAMRNVSDDPWTWYWETTGEKVTYFAWKAGEPSLLPSTRSGISFEGHDKRTWIAQSIVGATTIHGVFCE